MLPESLRRSCAIILGAEAAETLKFEMETKALRIPSEATISRFRLKLDVSCHYCTAANCSCIGCHCWVSAGLLVVIGHWSLVINLFLRF